MTQCTWQDPPDTRCTREATHPQTAEGGEVWANLCDEHAKQLDASVNGLIVEDNHNPAAVLRAWVRASGGAKKMAGRMMR